MNLNKFTWLFCFDLFLSNIPSLTLKFYLFLFCMPNENMIMVTKLHPSNHLQNSNQAKVIITRNAKNKSKERAHLILVHVLITVSRNEGTC